MDKEKWTMTFKNINNTEMIAKKSCLNINDRAILFMFLIYVNPELREYFYTNYNTILVIQE